MSLSEFKPTARCILKTMINGFDRVPDTARVQKTKAWLRQSKFICFLCVIVAILMFANVPAQAIIISDIEPVVAIGPDGSQAIKLELPDIQNSYSYMWLPLATPINTADHQVVTVEFDLYRNSRSATTWDHNMFWAWVDQNDSLMYPSDVPMWGAQWDLDQKTYPYGWTGPDKFGTPTIYDRYTHVSLTLDFPNFTASADYDGFVQSTVALNERPDFLYGFDITLHHGAPTGYGTDVAWIDNFVITGSDIYNSNGFTDFNLGRLDGQDGWRSGNDQPVPEPATMLLLGMGLIGLVCAKLRGREK